MNQIPGAPEIARAEVVVIGALHHFHARVPSYGFAELRRTIVSVSPNVLALELTADDLASRRPMQDAELHLRYFSEFVAA